MRENIWCSNITWRWSMLPIILVQSSILPGQLFQTITLNPWTTPKRKWVLYFKIIFSSAKMPLLSFVTSRDSLWAQRIKCTYYLFSHSSLFEIWNVKFCICYLYRKCYSPYSKFQFVPLISKKGDIYNCTCSIRVISGREEWNLLCLETYLRYCLSLSFLLFQGSCWWKARVSPFHQVRCSNC